MLGNIVAFRVGEIDGSRVGDGVGTRLGLIVGLQDGAVWEWTEEITVSLVVFVPA